MQRWCPMDARNQVGMLRAPKSVFGSALNGPSALQVRAHGAARRSVIRSSKTEPLIRVVVESEDAALMSAVVDELVAAVTGGRSSASGAN